MRRRLTAAGPRRPHLCGLRFFDLRRAGTPAAPKPVPATLVRHYPPHTQTVAYPTTQASNTRLPHDLLSGAQTNRPHTPPAAPPRAPLPDRHKKAAPGTGTATLHPHPRPHHPHPPLRAGWEKAPSSCHVFHVRAARKSAAPHLSPPPRTRPHQGKAPEPAPTHPHPRPPAPLSDSLLTRPTQAPPLATPQRPKKRHPASRQPPPRAFPHLQEPPLPGRHKKSGSPLKAAALRSNRRAISYP